MTRSSSNESSPPLMDNVGPRTETPFGGAEGRFSGEAWIWNELAVGASFCFLNMLELLALRAVCDVAVSSDDRAFAKTNRDASHSPRNRLLVRARRAQLARRRVRLMRD